MTVGQSKEIQQFVCEKNGAHYPLVYCGDTAQKTLNEHDESLTMHVGKMNPNQIVKVHMVIVE